MPLLAGVGPAGDLAQTSGWERCLRARFAGRLQSSVMRPPVSLATATAAGRAAVGSFGTTEITVPRARVEAARSARTSSAPPGAR